jgi:hypothetical protein
MDVKDRAKTALSHFRGEDGGSVYPTTDSGVLNDVSRTLTMGEHTNLGSSIVFGTTGMDEDE